MSETVLVTGGAGFIGSHAAERLLADGYRVVVVDNLNDYYNPKLKRRNLTSLRKQPGFVFYKADILQKRRLRNIFKKERPTKIVHLASEVGVRPSFERSAEYIQVNIIGTHHVLQLAGEAKVRQLIFASSSSIYGERAGKKGFAETDISAPISPYAATKRGAELLCRVYAREYKLKTTVLRFFTVYGPRNRPDMAIHKFIKAINKGEQIQLFGRGTKRDFTYVADIVEGIARALERPYPLEIINLGNSSPISIVKLVRVIEKHIGKKAKIRRGKLPPGDVPRTFANINKAKKLLGWQPETSIDTGMRQLIDWYKISGEL